MYAEKKPSADVVFALRMFMAKWKITPADLMKMLVVIDKGE